MKILGKNLITPPKFDHIPTISLSKYYSCFRFPAFYSTFFQKKKLVKLTGEMMCLFRQNIQQKGGNPFLCPYFLVYVVNVTL